MNNQARCNHILSISGTCGTSRNLSCLLTILLSILIRNLQPFHEGPIVLLTYNINIHYDSIVDNKDIEHESLGSAVCYEIVVRDAIYKIEDKECSPVQKKIESAGSTAACLPKKQKNNSMATVLAPS